MAKTTTPNGRPITAVVADHLEANATRPLGAESITFLPTADFLAGDYRPCWLAAGALVRGEPAVVAGPSKGLKSSLAVDLSVSLATGTPFLSRFRVPAPVRVMLASAESGRSSLQDAARRVMATRGLTAADVGDWLGWRFDVPILSDLASVEAWADGLSAAKADVFVLDPFYLSLGAVDAKNLFEVGACLRQVSARLGAGGRTVVIVHHAGRVMRPGEPMELSHLAYSGLEQFTRQFLLVNRRESYRSDGRHLLTLRTGGSAFSGGLFEVDIDEGRSGDDFAGRTWRVDIRPAGEGRPAEDGRREDEAERVRRDLAENRRRVLDAIDALSAAAPPTPATMTKLRDTAGMGLTVAERTVAVLVEDGAIELHLAPLPGRPHAEPVKAYRRVADAPKTPFERLLPD